jgi:hypothetical protein
VRIPGDFGVVMADPAQALAHALQQLDNLQQHNAQLHEQLQALQQGQQQFQQQHQLEIAELQQQHQGLVAAHQQPAVAPPAFNNHLSKNAKLSFYNGEKDSEELHAWVFHMSEYFACVGNPSEADKVRFAGVHLRGQAAIWWASIGAAADRPTTWQEFVAGPARQ